MYYVSAALLLLAVAGCSGCVRQTVPIPPTSPPAPVEEEILSSDRAHSNDRTNAWSGGGGIDWTHVGPGGQPNSGPSRTRDSPASPPSPPTPATPPKHVTSGELRKLSEELFALDVNAVGNLITLNPQGMASARGDTDEAPKGLITSVSSEALRRPTIAALWELLDNYSPSVSEEERVSPHEQDEREVFLTAVLSTSIMRKTEEFLKEKGFINEPLRDVLLRLWFTPYPRWRRTVGSSGFEHVFVGELKSGEVTGLHNWLSFYKEELEGDIDYKGYMRTLDLSDKAKIILLTFSWNRDAKPLGTIFVGTSPELEMALYTVCFLARPANNCPMELNGHRFNIKTHYQTYRGTKYVGTAYPNI